MVLALLADFPLQPMAVVRPLVIALLAGGLVTLVWVPVFGLDRGGVAGAVTVAALVGASDPARLALCLAAIGLLAVEMTWSRRGTMRLHIPWTRITSALNLVLLVLVGLQVGRAVMLRSQQVPLPMPAGWSVDEPVARPDVFLILTDGHGRGDVLESGYGYDMRPLREALTATGFTESPASHTNHSVTKYSLSVLLNGRPMTDLGQDLRTPADENIPFVALAPSSGVRLFEEAGYESVVISSGYDHLPLRDVDRYIDVGPRTEIEQSLWEATALGRALDATTQGFASDARARVFLELDLLRDLAIQPAPRPQLVLAHLPAPHLPIVLEADCELRPADAYTAGGVGRDGRAGDRVAVQVTADQHRCVDELLAGAVTQLVEARPDAVIIVFSDHGPEERLDWWAPTEPGVLDRMANLFFARTPGQLDLFPDDISLVNVLPLIANSYLGTSIPIQPDDLYLGPTKVDPRFVPYLPRQSRGSLHRARLNRIHRRPLRAQQFRPSGVSSRSCPP
jgi:hypothetical protein